MMNKSEDVRKSIMDRVAGIGLSMLFVLNMISGCNRFRDGEVNVDVREDGDGDTILEAGGPPPAGVVSDAQYDAHVWEDLDDDRIEDAGERPLAGVVIQFVGPETGWFWQRGATDANGDLSVFSAGGICGDYMMILVVPDGFWPTTSVTEADCDASFGLKPYPQGPALFENSP